MRHTSDLVRDSKLNTAVRGDITRHLIPTSDRDDQHRLIHKEQRWQRVCFLGEGAFGLVWKEKLDRGESDIDERAVKMIRKRVGQHQTTDYSRELEAIAKFSGREYGAYFVQSYGWYESPDAVFITMEYFEHGDLQDYLDKLPTGGRMPEKEVQLVSYQILEGLRIMHENDFAHRDLKPANILIRRTNDHEKGWWVKIGDFGISKRAEDNMTAFRTFGGTPGFLAPEILAQNGLLDDEFLGGKCDYTVSVDIWSMGEIIYRLVTGASPFVKNLGAYVRGNEGFPTQLLKSLSIKDPGIDLIEKLMKPLPDARLTAEQALKHPWFEAFLEKQDTPRSSGEFVNIGTIQSDLLTPMFGALSSGGSSFEFSDASAKWSTISDPTLKQPNTGLTTPSKSNLDISSRIVQGPSIASTSSIIRRKPIRDPSLSNTVVGIANSKDENTIHPPAPDVTAHPAPEAAISELSEDLDATHSRPTPGPVQPRATIQPETSGPAEAETQMNLQTETIKSLHNLKTKYPERYPADPEFDQGAQETPMQSLEAYGTATIYNSSRLAAYKTASDSDDSIAPPFDDHNRFSFELQRKSTELPEVQRGKRVSAVPPLADEKGKDDARPFSAESSTTGLSEVDHGRKKLNPAHEAQDSEKRGLKSWWKQLSKRKPATKEQDNDPEPGGVFGVPLLTSIPYANVAISLFNENGESYIYGYIPIVVAKTGVFLKENGADVDGIFQQATSTERLKLLTSAFDTPPRWGKGFDWTGTTVHEAASLLASYINGLPAPLVPLLNYDTFRQPLLGHQIEGSGTVMHLIHSPEKGNFDPDEAIRVYQHLVRELPSLHRHLLLYLLDFLAIFAAKSDINGATPTVLATAFQPGILSHPQHYHSEKDNRLNQDVIIFLIDNQDHFLIGMDDTT